MDATFRPVDGLPAEQRQQVEAYLAEFERCWDKNLLAARVRTLSAEGHPLRLRLLLGMALIDLYRRWRQGQSATVEAYLKLLPELKARPDDFLTLVLAEVSARQAAGSPAELPDLVRRFPDLAEQLRRRLGQTLGGERASPPERAETCAFEASGTVADKAPWPGGVLPEMFGRYRLGRQLGQGGMGTVYLAHDTQLDRPVALKVPHFRADDRLGRRFLQEARAAARVTHANLCPVYDVGEVDGVLYYTMPYLEGKSLSSFVRGGRGLPLRQVALLGRKLALAMGEAHAHGLIHRDLKPSNVLVNPRSEPIILDFGLARVQTQQDSRLTEMGALLGTPAYMSPEQVLGDNEAVGPASDQYSLGVILYELATGKVPFEGPPMLVMARVLGAEPPPLSEHLPDVSPAFEAICAQAMAKKAAERYPSMAALAEALTGFLRNPEAEPGLLPLSEVEDAPARVAEATEVRAARATVLPSGDGARRATLRTTRSEAAEEVPYVREAPPSDTVAEVPERRRPRKQRRKRQQQPGWVWGLLGAAGLLALVIGIGLVIKFASGKKEAEPAGKPTEEARTADRPGPPQGPGRPLPPPLKPPVRPPAVGQPGDLPPGWVRCRPLGAGFSAFLPGTPTFRQQVMQVATGKMVLFDYSFRQGDVSYQVAYSEMAKAVPPGQVETSLVGGRNGVLQSQPGSRLLWEKARTRDGCRGKEFEVSLASGAVLRGQMFLAGKRIYLLLVQRPRDLPTQEDIDIFLASLRLYPE